MTSKGLNIVSLFAGAGGLEIAACSTGMVRRLISTDSNPVFLSTTEQNMPSHFPNVEHRSLVADIRELDADRLKNLMERPVDIVMGGPPCDDFTRWGRQYGMNGQKGPLINEFKRLTCALGPVLFMFENVPNLVQQFRQDFETYIAGWNSFGWHCKWKLIDASKYGAPTLRKRVILIGSRDKTVVDHFLFPSPTHGICSGQLSIFSSGLKRFINVKDVLEGLPDVKTEEAKSLGLKNHDGRTHRPATIEHIRTVPPGSQTGKSRRYRVPWDGLCWSLTAGMDNSTKSYIHPRFHREMSVREYARIHCFPDSWLFKGTHHNGIKQVANAVPIPLGVAIWQQIHCLLGTSADPIS